MEKLRIMSVFGTRPEAIKMAPLVKELASREEIESICCVTAQHREMLDSVLKVFELKRRFAEKAAEEIYSHRNTFQSMIDAGGTDALLSFIQLHSIALQSTEMNSWRTALYKALTNVDQYVVNGKLAF